MMSSSLEVKIHNILTDYDVPFAEEYEFSDLIASSGRHLRFDFAVFSEDGNLDFLIEAQGRQHYTAVSKFGGSKGVGRQKYNDQQKRKYCLDHNIKLICIPYYDEGKLDYDYIMRAAGY
jgi:hypothetical protein